MRSLVPAVTLVLAFIINPMFACNPYEPAFQYGEREMKLAVEGTWKLTFRDHVYTLQIRQAQAVKQHVYGSAGLVRSAAAACAHRTFVKSAEACVDYSDMPLAIVTTGPTGETAPKIEGIFQVFSTQFRQGELGLDVGGKAIGATLTPKGEVLEMHADPELGATIERLAG